MRKLFAVSVLLLFFSCQKKRTVPEGIMEPRKMQSVFWDYIRADVFARDFVKNTHSGNDTIANLELQNKLFAFHKVTREEFYKSYSYYTNHPELMNVLMDSMIAKQNRLKLKDQFKSNKKKTPGFTFPIQKTKESLNRE